MKKTITTVTTMLISALSIFSYGQDITDSLTSDSEIICKTVDEFTDEVSFNITGKIIYADGGDMKTEGMIMDLFLNNKNGKLKAGTLYLKVAGMKGCVDEGSILIVMFENGEKTTLVNWNDFSCKGVNYFTLSNDKLDLFKNNKIKAMKYTNKRSYESMVVKTNLDEGSKSFISNVLLEIDKINNGELNVGICE